MWFHFSVITLRYRMKPFVVIKNDCCCDLIFFVCYIITSKYQQICHVRYLPVAHWRESKRSFCSQSTQWSWCQIMLALQKSVLYKYVMADCIYRIGLFGRPWWSWSSSTTLVRCTRNTGNILKWLLRKKTSIIPSARVCFWILVTSTTKLDEQGSTTRIIILWSMDNGRKLGVQHSWQEDVTVTWSRCSDCQHPFC